MKITITTGDKRAERQAQVLEASTDQKIPVHLPADIHVLREGEPPVRITKLADGIVVQWKDGFQIVLVPENGDNELLRQASINGENEGAPVDAFMNWQATYDDGLLDFAPLSPYSVPPVESPELDDLYARELESTPVVTQLLQPPPPPSGGSPLVVPPDLPPIGFDDTNFVTEPQSPAPLISGNVLQNISHGSYGSFGPFADQADVDPEGGGLAVSLVASSKPEVVPVVPDADGETIEGLYGTLTMQSDGSYVYDLDEQNPAPDGLNEGGSLLEVFTYTTIDGSGQTVTAKLTITIIGLNDVPIAVADTNGNDVVTEAGVNPGNTAFPGDPAATGNVLANDTDADVGDTKAVSAVNGSGANVGAAVVGTYGSVVINSDGTYTYALNNANTGTNALPQGQSVTDVFNYTVIDANGATSASTLTITIAGTNDLPTIDATNPTPFTEDQNASAQDLSLSGTVSFSDVDTGDVVDIAVSYNGDLLWSGGTTTVAQTSALTVGTLTASATNAAAPGSVPWDFVVNNANLDFLGVGETITFSFTITATDGNGATATDTVSFTLTGTNDAPTVDATDATGFTEALNASAQDLSQSGTVNFDDIDVNDVVDISAAYNNNILWSGGALTAGQISALTAGTFAATATNAAAPGSTSWNYTANDVNLDFLSVGETITFSYTITATDNSNATATDTVTITITGTNDAPVAVADTNAGDAVTESGVNPGNTAFPGDPTASGNVLTNDTDVDTVDTKAVSAVNGSGPNVGAAVAGTYGSVVINTNGTYTYTLNNADTDTNALAQGQTITDVFNYTVIDANGATSTATLTITITGTNDAPIAVADTNAGDAVSESGLNPGNTAFPGDPTATGNVLTNDTDVDTGDTKAVSAVNGSGPNVGAAVAGTYGSVVINTNGTYTYTLNNADSDTNALAQGQSVTDVFNYTVIDANGATSTTTLTITITGTNDAPVAVANTNAGDAVTESGVNPANTAFPGDPTAAGNVLTNDTDVDTGDTKAVSAVNGSGPNVGAAVAGTYGSVVINTNGTYTYTLNNADTDTNALAQGQTVTDVFNYTVIDANGATSTSTLTITITGTNDIPVAVADTNAGDAVTESGVNPGNTAFAGDPTAAGNVLTNDTDVDTGDTKAVSQVNGSGANVGNAVVGTYGSVTILTNGTYTYTLNNADTDTNALAQGQSVTDVFNYTVIDANGATSTATLTITITGTNDAPVAVANTNAGDAVTESGVNPANTPFPGDPTAVGNVLTNDTDVDTGDTKAVSAVNGSGANVGNAVVGTYGSVTILTNGTYTYTLNNSDTDTNALAQGQSVTDVFNYTVVDANGATSTSTLTITITGTNDTPVAVADTNAGDAVTEQGVNPGNTAFAGDPTAAGNVLTNDTDVDTGDTKAVSAVNGSGPNVGAAVAGTYGSVVINTNGTYSYTLNNSDTDTNALAQGQTVTDVFNYTVIDANGATSTSTLTITITGTNDTPVAVADTNAGDAVTEQGVNPANTAFPGDPTAAGNVLTNDTDVDTGDTKAVSAVNGSGPNVGAAVAGTYGSVVINTNGAYTYTLNNADTDTNALAQGQTVTDIFNYTVVDANGATSTSTLTITITGTNDTPVAVADTNAGDAVTEQGVNPGNTAFAGDPTAAGNVLTNDTDVDTGDTKAVSAVNGSGPNVGAAVAGTYGSVVINTNGTYTYTLNNADTDTNALAQGQTVTDVFNYTVVDANGATSTATLTITITGTNDAPIAVADTNAGDAVTESGVNPGNTAFAGDPTAVGNVLTNDTDVDTGDTKAVSQVNGSGASVGNPVVGTYGSVTILATGGYTYTLNNADTDTNALAQGQTVTDVFNYTVVDANGATSTSTLTITLTGTNDAPIAVADTNAGDAVTEQGVNPANTAFPGDPTAAGNVLTNDTDVDTGDTKAVSAVNGSGASVGNPVVGTYGSVTILATGGYTYTLNNADTDTNALAQGQTVTDVFNYTVIDANGATSTATLTITITGTNDTPVAVADTNAGDAVTEQGVNPANTPFAGDPTAVGNVLTNDTDVDTGDTKAVSAVNGSGASVGNAVAGTYGSVTILATGGYTYTLNNSDTDTNALAQGQSVTDVFNYTVIDANGATSTATLTITITGTNDTPVAVADTNAGDAVTESGVNPGNTAFAGDPTAVGNVLTNDTDVDTGDTKAVSQVNGSGVNVGNPVAGTYGAVTILATGGYTYTLNNADTDTNALAQGQTVTDVFNYAVIDANGATSTSTLTITITGTNDAPIAVADTNAGDAVTEQGVNPANTAFPGDPTAAGNVLTNDTDVDTGDTKAVSAVNGSGPNVGAAVAGTYGSVVINTNGTYTYTLNNADTDTNALAQGQTVTDVFNYTVVDANGATSTATLTITITGTNDTPVAVADTNAGDAVTESGVNPGNTAFAGDPTAVGNVLTNDTDVDTGDTKAVSQVNGSGASVGNPVIGTYGSVVINTNGTYTYTLNNADTDTNALAQGQTVTDVFNYTVVDANGATSTSTLTITLTGTNDTPVAVADTNAGDAVTEQGVNPGNTAFAGDPTATGNVLTNDTDVDTGDTKAVSQVNGSGPNVGAAVAGTYGSVVINTNGTYTYTLNNADTDTNALAQGQTVTDVFNYTVIDANGATSTATLTITITGTNDAPIAVADTNAGDAVTESGVNPGNTAFPGDPTAAGNVLTNDTDVDTGDTKAVSQVNGSGASVGNPVIGTYGSVVINTNGTYTYTLNNADTDTNALAQGQTVTDVFNYTVVDANGATSTSTLTITLTGTNDTPVAVADTNAGDAVTESGVNPGNVAFPGDPTAVGNVLTNDTDVDTGDTKAVSQVNGSGASVGNPVAGTYGSVTILATGGYTYTLNNADTDTNALAQGQSVTDVFNYTVVDANGATSTATLTITITGTNDTPVAVADTNAGDAVTESGVNPGNTAFPGDSTAAGNVLTNDTDVDTGDTKAVSAVNGSGPNVGAAVAGTYGSVVINTNGTYTYTLNNADTDTNALAQGQSVTDVFNYTVIDGNGATSTATLTITITGTNDAPIAVADTNAGDAVTEQGVNPANTAFAGDPTAAGNVLTNDTDVDTGDTKAVSQVNGSGPNVGSAVAGTYGSVVINTNGTYTYTLNNADTDTNALAQGQTVTDVFNYTVVDANGATSTSTLTITITGTNDTPVAVADTNAGDAVTEQGVNPGNTAFAGDPAAVGNVLTNDTDVDTGDTKTVSQVNGTGANVGNAVAGTYGSVTILAAGGYTYTLNNADTDTNALAQGQTVTDVFNYTVVDANGATSTSTLTITITGTNDAPVAVADTNAGDAVTESGVNPGNTAFPGDSTAAGNVLTNDTDVDTGDTKAVTAVNGSGPNVGAAVVGTYGSVVINTNGTYTYTLNNADTDTNALAQGQSVTDVFNYTVIDANGATSTATLTITITGTNDAPIAVADTNAGDAVTEQGVNPGNTAFAGDPTAAGNVLTNDTDVDTGDTKAVSAVNGSGPNVGAAVVGTYGSVVINTNGTYTYTLNNADTDTNALALGQSVTDVFNYTVVDANGATSTSTLTITITGTNDAPVAVADTNAGDAVTESGVNPGNTAFAGDPTAAGNVLTNDTDVDTGDTKAVSQVNGTGANVGNAVAGTYGSVTILAAGGYTYTLNNADTDTNALAQGQTVTDVFNYTVIDANGATSTSTLTITITGTNDAPVAVADTNAGDAVTESGVNPGNTAFPGDSTAAGNVLTNDTDVDTGDTKAVSQVNGSGASVGNPVIGTYGSVVINTNGTYTYTLNNADTDTNALAQGQSVTDVFNYTVVDANGATSTATLTITITGTNDAPVAVADTNAGDAVTESGVNPGNTAFPGDPTAAGNVLTNDTDVDTGDTKAVSQVNGSGANIGIAVAGTYGSVVINTNGTYTYTLDNADTDTNALAQGQSVTDVFNYTVVDANGATSTSTLTVTITGTNDAPVAVADTNAGDAVTESGVNPGNTAFAGDPTATGNVLPNDTDVDTGDTKAVSAVNGSGPNVGAAVAGIYGSVVINNDGTYTYTLNNADADTNALDHGQAVTDVFNYTVVDSNGATSTATLTITITGTNDVPTVDATAATAFTEAADASAQNLLQSGTVSFDDVDANDVIDITASYNGDIAWSNGALTAGQIAALTAGVFTASATDAAAPGSTPWNYAANGVNLDFLDSGETITFSFTVTATDSNGATATDTVNFTINGANDAPVAPSISVWMSSDPAQQTLTSPAYADGYPVTVPVPTDVDGENVTVTASNAPTGLFYFNGVSYVALTAGTVLYDATGSINLLDNLVYRPTATVNDIPVNVLNLSVTDGTATVLQTVTLNEIAPNRLPGASSQVGDGKDPLTSGSGQVATLALNQSFVDGIINNLAGASIIVFTDFQQTPFATPVPAGEQNPNGFNGNSTGTAREVEVQVEIQINGNKFAVIEDDTSVGDFEQSWFYDATSGLMKATVSYSNIFLLDGLGNATATTLASYLTSNPPAAGDVWTLIYTDDTPGNNQARFVRFEFFFSDPGDPGIVVNGDGTIADLIYGTSGVDNLNGNGGADLIEGRGGNDVITGGTGADTITGGLGNDSLAGGADSDTFIWLAGDEGTVATPALDSISDFSITANTDRIDLRGLLLGETHPVDNSTAGNLANYLHFTLSGSNTILQISVAGAFFGQGNIQSTTLDVTSETQLITFTGVDLVTGFANQDAIIQNLLTNGKLLTDTGAPPVVLDLDGDGLEFTSLLDSGAHFDFNGDGVLEKTAWVHPDDGILVYDANGDQIANDGSEIAFAGMHPEAQTDLDGLRLAFDSNFDNLLDSRDLNFSKFGVWQDLDGDGTTDAGEFHTLTDAGISSISLVSDGQGHLAANGDVFVFGQGDFTFHDGGKGTFGDVALNTIVEDQPVMGPLQQSPTLDLAQFMEGTNATVDALLPPPSANSPAQTDSSAPGNVAAASSDAAPAADQNSASANTEASHASESSDPAPVAVPDAVAHMEDAPAAVA